MSKKPFHPILFALSPGLLMLAANVSQVLFEDTLRILVFSLLLACVIWSVSYLITRGGQKAALLTSLVLIVFFSYGHVFSVLRGLAIGSILIGRTIIVLPAFLFALALSSWWILTWHSDASKITQGVNVIGLFLLAVPLFNVSSYYVRAAIVESAQTVEFPAELRSLFEGEVPSIYYIILDMRARSDVLETIYDYDDSDFIDTLESLGFYIAEQSTSNYSSTLQSLSSSLNMGYINYLQDIYGADSNNREPLGQLLSQNKVIEILTELGYKTGAFQTGDFYTEFRFADEYIKPTAEQIRRYQNFWSLNAFESTFLNTTLARVFYDISILSSEIVIEKTIETPYRLHRLTILNTIDHLPDFAEKEAPYFVFAHIVSPHPPYIFGLDGRELQHSEPFSLSGPGRQNGGPEYVRLYVDQLRYIDQLILKAVEEILARSQAPPIIIIQADHGPVSFNGENEIERSNMKEQHAILNAYYFPGGKYELLYPSVTPVNSFRIVLNTFFNGEYELLSDRNYFIPHARPYDFVDVTDRVKTDVLTTGSAAP